MQVIGIEVGRTYIFTHTNGFVSVGEVEAIQGVFVTFKRNRIVRRWGTSSGQNELVKGLTSTTSYNEGYKMCLITALVGVSMPLNEEQAEQHLSTIVW